MYKKNNLKNIIKNLNIVDIINDYVFLNKKGCNNFFGLCPFHNEKTPSFSVNFFKNFFYCFGCKASGNIIDFFIKYKKINFKEALKELYNLKKNKNKYKKIYNNNYINFKNSILSISEIKSLYNLTKNIKIYYNNLLLNNNFALNYLKKRGFNINTINYFNLGFCEDWFKTKYKFLNYSNNILLQTGLIKKNLNYYYNILNNRIIFPINNIKGNTVGFSGRNINDNKPKYLNSQDTYIFKKKKILYGIWEIQKVINYYNYIIIVEGYTDVLSLFQNGFKNVLGSMGCCINKYQFNQIFKLTNNIIICFDNDFAGINGIKNSIKIFFSFNYLKKNIKFIILPKNFDPDKYLNYFGKKFFKRKLKNSINLYKMIYKLYVKNIYNKKNNLILDKLNEFKLFIKNIYNVKYKKKFLYLLSKNININLKNFFFILDDKYYFKNYFNLTVYWNYFEINILKKLLIFPNIIYYFNKNFLDNLLQLSKNKILFSEIINIINLLEKVNFIELNFKLNKSKNYIFYKNLILKNYNIKLFNLLNVNFNKKLFIKINIFQKKIYKKNILIYYKLINYIIKFINIF